MNKAAHHPPQIVIFGGSEPIESDPIFQIAEALGSAIAAQGWTLVNGGYGGTMLASARGAAQAGGRVVGVTCSIFRGQPNSYLTESVPTTNLHERLRELIDRGDAYVALPGSTGTLAELALVWELVNKQLIARRPILCWGDFWRPVTSLFDCDPTADPRFDTSGLPARRGDLVASVQTVPELIAVLQKAFCSNASLA